VVLAVAENRVYSVCRRHSVRNGADAADALRERDRVVDVAAEQEVLETTPQVTVHVGLGDCATSFSDLDTQVTLDA
jgi:hypothetical protein